METVPLLVRVTSTMPVHAPNRLHPTVLALRARTAAEPGRWASSICFETMLILEMSHSKEQKLHGR
jgi:hypothetical protein